MLDVKMIRQNFAEVQSKLATRGVHNQAQAERAQYRGGDDITVWA